MDKEDVAHIGNGILPSHKTEWNLDVLENMDGPKRYYVKWNKLDKERQLSYDLTFNWKIINKRKKQTKYNQRHWN